MAWTGPDLAWAGPDLAWAGPDLAWAGRIWPAWVARALGRAWVRACAAPGCAPVLHRCLAWVLTGGGKRGGKEEKGRRKKEEKERRERKVRERERGEREKENFECARVFRRSKPDYIAFGFFVKHKKLPIYPFLKKYSYHKIKLNQKLKPLLMVLRRQRQRLQVDG